MTKQLSRQSMAGALLLLFAMAAIGSAPPAQAKDALTLRVNDAFAEPGGLAAIVVRTYATKPIGQGQLCFRSRPAGAGITDGAFVAAAATDSDVFAELVGVKVFAKRKDALVDASFETAGGERMIVIQFSSDSATINRVDGPLAVIYYRISENVTPGSEYRIEIDAANTLVLDGNGNPIKFAPRAGRLRIRRPSEPFEAEAEGDKIRPGERAELGLETFEPVAMSSGQVGITYDPAIASGRPKVKLKRKYGRRKFSVERSTPGLVLVTFRSSNSSWNLVPGQIISIRLPTSRRVPIGTRSPVRIDPSLTFFVGSDGETLPYEFENGSVRFRNKSSGGGDDDGDD